MCLDHNLEAHEGTTSTLVVDERGDRFEFLQCKRKRVAMLQHIAFYCGVH
jgi:hypothetical protein